MSATPAVVTSAEELKQPAELIAALPRLLSWPPPLDERAPRANLERIPGGITNTIYRLDPIQSNLDRAITTTSPVACRAATALVRVFGAPDIFPPSARARENDIFAALAAAALAPGLLAVFGNGRVEAYIPGAAPLPLRDMTLPALCCPIARRLARLHAFVPPPPPQPRQKTEMKAEAAAQAEEAESSGATGEQQLREATLFEQLDEWAAHIEHADLPLPRAARVRDVHARLQKAAVATRAPVVFAHNDLLAGNILRGSGASRGDADEEEEEEVTLIDFEYAGWNYRGFDMANFFAECMGGTQDGNVHPELYPSTEYRRTFCQAYLAEQRKNARGSGDGSSGGSGEEKEDEKEEEELEKLLREVAVFDPLTHLYWGLWGVIQSEKSTIDFPYLEFAHQRLDQCLQRSDRILSSA